MASPPPDRPLIEELDFRPTPIGDLTLRRRTDLRSGDDIYEVKLGDEFLMSSLFTVSEIALADIALSRTHGTQLDVVVGGLGLGYTARAALADDRVASLLVVDALRPVIDWHQSGLVPLGATLTNDRRCTFLEGDFFKLAEDTGFDATQPDRQFDAILVDIDHSPERYLNAGHSTFYRPGGLASVQTRLKPGGVFALWSDDPPDADFTGRLAGIFNEATAEPVTFDSLSGHRRVTQTIYVGQKGPV